LRFDGGITISFLTKKTVLYLSLLFISGFLFCGAASAATIPVNNVTGLQNAIYTAHPGDTLNLSAGTYHEDKILVNKNLTITGPPTTHGNPLPTALINGAERGELEPQGRIFNIQTGVTVTLQYLLIQYGNATAETDPSGGGIYNNGTLNVYKCIIQKNTATFGGGIYTSDGSTLTLTDSNVYNNTASRCGAIYNQEGTVTLTRSNVYNNTAATESGGGILNIGTMTLTDSNVYNNTAVGRGGGIYNVGLMTLTRSNVYQNTVTRYYDYGIWSWIGDGGGIYNQDDGSVTLTDSNVYNNTAGYRGGGILNCNIHGDGSTVTLTGSNVYNNIATTDDGGGIGNFGGTVTLTGSNVYNNTASYCGGGIANEFHDVFLGTATVNACNIYNNTANSGGGIFNYQGTGTVTGSNIYNNTATSWGGGIDNAVSNMTLTFCRIIGNTAPSGTAIYCDSGGSVNATLNWWGSNNNPSSNVYGNVNVNPWLVLNVVANPTSINNGGKSNITGEILYDSNGEYNDPTSGHVPDGIPISFATTLGTITSPLSTVNGVATSILVGGAVSGVADVSATVNSQTVHTSVTIDNTVPTVISTNPAQYAVNLPSNQVFTVTFSEAIKAGNLNLVVLKTSTGTVIATTKSISGNVLTITPNSALGEAKYLLLLYAGCVTDLAGNPAAALSRTYSVGAQPYVTSTDPANYAVNVARNKVITATFNEPIVAKYLTLIYLKTSIGGILVSTTKSVSGNVLTITPTSPLAAGTRYMLLIYTFAVTDLSGNSNVNKAISFTTGAT
jgi:methionine-rich copper-binding protein CopC